MGGAVHLLCRPAHGEIKQLPISGVWNQQGWGVGGWGLEPGYRGGLPAGHEARRVAGSRATVAVQIDIAPASRRKSCGAAAPTKAVRALAVSQLGGAGAGCTHMGGRRPLQHRQRQGLRRVKGVEGWAGGGGAVGSPTSRRGGFIKPTPPIHSAGVAQAVRKQSCASKGTAGCWGLQGPQCKGRRGATRGCRGGALRTPASAPQVAAVGGQRQDEHAPIANAEVASRVVVYLGTRRRRTHAVCVDRGLDGTAVRQRKCPKPAHK